MRGYWYSSRFGPMVSDAEVTHFQRGSEWRFGQRQPRILRLLTAFVAQDDRSWGRGRFSGGLLAGKRALPDAKQQFLELGETLGAKLCGPFTLNVAQYVVDF